MWISLALVVSTFVVLKATNDSNAYKTCASTAIKSGSDWEKHILCKVATFNMQDHDNIALMNGTIKFMNCAFVKIGWMDKGTKELRAKQIIKDLKTKTDKREQIENCKSTDQEKRNGMKYLECLTRRHNKTDTGALAWIKNREPDFFSKNHCQGVVF